MENTSTVTRVLVYNKYNFLSVLCAGILKNKLKLEAVVDVATVNRDSMGTEYIWIGMDPRKVCLENFMEIRAESHIVFTDDSPEINATLLRRKITLSTDKYKEALVLTSEYLKLHDVYENTDVCKVKDINLIDRVCNHFNLKDESNYDKDFLNSLSFHSKRFHEKLTEVESIAFVYSNLKRANLAIVSNSVFDYCLAHESYTGNSDKSSVVVEYMKDVSKVKEKLSINYKITVVKSNGVKQRVALLTKSDFDAHLSIRLLKFSYDNYVNVSYGLEGIVAHSNLRNIETDLLQKAIVLNS